VNRLKINIVDILDQKSRDNNDLKIENKSMIQKLEKSNQNFLIITHNVTKLLKNLFMVQETRSLVFLIAIV
jgi:hypothetical protein